MVVRLFKAQVDSGANRDETRKMKLDQFTITLLILRPDAPRLDEKSASALQDAHMAHLAKLHESGFLLAEVPSKGRTASSEA